MAAPGIGDTSHPTKPSPRSSTTTTPRPQHPRSQP
jgi:hypothetical protein